MFKPEAKIRGFDCEECIKEDVCNCKDIYQDRVRQNNTNIHNEREWIRSETRCLKFSMKHNIISR